MRSSLARWWLLVQSKMIAPYSRWGRTNKLWIVSKYLDFNMYDKGFSGFNKLLHFEMIWLIWCSKVSVSSRKSPRCLWNKFRGIMSPLIKTLEWIRRPLRFDLKIISQLLFALNTIFHLSAHFVRFCKSPCRRLWAICISSSFPTGRKRQLSSAYK